MTGLAPFGPFSQNWATLTEKHLVTLGTMSSNGCLTFQPAAIFVAKKLKLQFSTEKKLSSSRAETDTEPARPDCAIFGHLGEL